jgi:uncharacterized protein (TIGR02391 family)
MSSVLRLAERIARNVHRFSERSDEASALHPFEVRDFHSSLPPMVRSLFDNTHYSQATFEACKFLDAEVQRLSGIDKSGFALMMEALKEGSPLLRLSPLETQSQRDEQMGYRFLFAGTMIAIRNPRGHDHSMVDEVGTCLEHLSLVSHLLRKLEKAGYTLAGRSLDA